MGSTKRNNKGPIVLTAELIPAGLAGKGLSKLLPSSVWSRFRARLIEQARSRCEICHSYDEPLHAHEVWECLDAADAPWLDPDTVNGSIAEHLAAERRKYEELAAIFDRIAPGRVRVQPKFRSAEAIIPKIAILDRGQALCRLCHLCKHYKCVWNKPQQLRGGAGEIMRHWCRINQRTQSAFIEYYRDQLACIKNVLVIKVEYCGYDELSDFKTVADWQDAQREEAELYDEDFRLYEHPSIWAGP